jgi:glucose/arabinose dehydrogenase
MYTYTSEPVSGKADFTYPLLGTNCPGAPKGLAPDHQNVLREWTVPNPGDLASRPQATSRVVMRMDWGNYNHNGGMLAFGPDGMLYLSTGDGGGEDDQTCQVNGDKKPTIGHSPIGNSQDTRLIYGKMLRIDPTQRTSANGQYGVPADNPFVKDPRYLPEIYALGLRNFWRFSFDTPTGALIGGDVGQITIEEVDLIRAGGNYGWRVKEGTGVFDPQAFELSPAGETDGIPIQLVPGYPEGLTDPIAQYAHEVQNKTQGQAIIGGYVYRGTAVPQLSGKYIFGDYAASEDPNASVGRLLVLPDVSDAELRGTAPAPMHEVQLLTDMPIDIHVLGFAQDASGELYVLGNQTGTPKGQTGQVRRLVAP